MDKHDGNKISSILEVNLFWLLGQREEALHLFSKCLKELFANWKELPLKYEISLRGMFVGASVQRVLFEDISNEESLSMLKDDVGSILDM